MGLDQILTFITEDLPKIVQALLMVLGGLKVIARYTRWAWDDQLLQMIESPLRLFRANPKPEEKEDSDESR